MADLLIGFGVTVVGSFGLAWLLGRGANRLRDDDRKDGRR